MKSAKKNRSVAAGSKRARMGAKAEASGPSTGVVEEQLNRRIDKLQAQLDSMEGLDYIELGEPIYWGKR